VHLVGRILLALCGLVHIGGASQSLFWLVALGSHTEVHVLVAGLLQLLLLQEHPSDTVLRRRNLRQLFMHLEVLRPDSAAVGSEWLRLLLWTRAGRRWGWIGPEGLQLTASKILILIGSCIDSPEEWGSK
jgi:hypothetical protein